MNKSAAISSFVLTFLACVVFAILSTGCSSATTVGSKVPPPGISAPTNDMQVPTSPESQARDPNDPTTQIVFTSLPKRRQPVTDMIPVKLVGDKAVKVPANVTNNR